MPTLQHAPSVEEVPGLGFRPVCGCGWRSKMNVGVLPKKESVALEKARQHARDKGCGKQRFTEGEASQALFNAKIARGVKHNGRRREQRAYRCPDCQGNVWHLTSMED